MENNKVVSCPICEFLDCGELILDLVICNACNHIFKGDVIEWTTSIEGDALHRYDWPVQRCQIIHDQLSEDQIMTFSFPSMNFYSLDINPSLFYKYEYNHYFNQMSLMVLLERAGLVPIEQTNVWSGTVCNTKITVRKRKVDEYV